MADILQAIERYRALGIDQQIDYKKFYLYSIITHSTALSIESENENCLVGPYEEIPTREELAALLHVSVKTIGRRLAKLPHIKYVGSGYSGHWEIIENEK